MLKLRVSSLKKIEISEEYIYSLIKKLNNWKAPGPVKVYNFFIKKLSSIHLPIYKAIEKAIREPESVPKSFFIGNTYLIPKGEPRNASQFRPITCMNNLYKLLTKAIAHYLQTF